MRAFVLAAALTLAATPALAHKLKVFAGSEGAAIVGTAYFAGGGKAQQADGRLLGPDGAVLAQFQTDGDGGFRLPVPLRQDYRIHVDSGDGHVAETVVSAAEFPTSLPAGGASPAAAPSALATIAADPVEAAVARQILPLRMQIDAMEERARFSDIMGGIGTIFGLFGVGAWIAARRGRKP